MTQPRRDRVTPVTETPTRVVVKSPGALRTLRTSCAVTDMGYHCYTQHGGVVRRYRTKEERVSWLKEYQTDLEHELQAVKERIAQVEAE